MSTIIKELHYSPKPKFGLIISKFMNTATIKTLQKTMWTSFLVVVFSLFPLLSAQGAEIMNAQPIVTSEDISVFVGETVEVTTSFETSELPNLLVSGDVPAGIALRVKKDDGAGTLVLDTNEFTKTGLGAYTFVVSKEKFSAGSYMVTIEKEDGTQFTFGTTGFTVQTITNAQPVITVANAKIGETITITTAFDTTEIPGLFVQNNLLPGTVLKVVNTNTNAVVLSQNELQKTGDATYTFKLTSAKFTPGTYTIVLEKEDGTSFQLGSTYLDVLPADIFNAEPSIIKNIFGPGETVTVMTRFMTTEFPDILTSMDIPSGVQMEIVSDKGEKILVTANFDHPETGKYTFVLSQEKFPFGNYEITIKKGDGTPFSFGTTGFTVADQTAPVITLTGANPLQLTVGATFTDPGATAVDDVDGAVTVSVNMTGLNVNAVGSYTVTYTATDKAGNIATVTRTVNVVSVEIPQPPTTPSGGGGGGGGSFFVAGPKNPSINIVDDSLNTTNNTFTVNLSASDAPTEMAISTDSTFAGVSMEPFVPSLTFTYPQGFIGPFTLHAKFKNASGTSGTVSDTITIALVLGTKIPGCALDADAAYKSVGNPAVYYITEKCTKRAFTSPAKFFSYFKSWNDVQTTSKKNLDEIADDTLGFMPWGPLWDPKYGAIVKNIKDSNVYFLANGEKLWIKTAAILTALYGVDGSSWIQDVDKTLLDKYADGTTIDYTNHHPNFTIVKYAGSSKVYRLEPQENDPIKQIKRHIVSLDLFKSLGYRTDRIAVIANTEVYEDGAPITQ